MEKNHLLNQLTTLSKSLTALITAGLFLQASAVAQSSGGIDFGTTKIPEVKAPLTVVRLSNQSAPTAFIKDALTKMGADATQIGPLSKAPQLASRSANIPGSVMGLISGGQLRAYWDQKSGDAEIFPLLDNTKALSMASSDQLALDHHAAEASPAFTQKLNGAATSAKQIFARTDILPQDATQFTVGEARPVMGATAAKDGNSGTVNEAGGTLYLTYVAAQRKVDGYSVYGPGSRALVAFGADGSVQGFLKRVKAGVASGTVRETRTADQVKGAISDLLQPLAKSATVNVLSVEVAYYDNHTDSISPVYRITAKVHNQPGNVDGVKAAGQLANDNFIVRYLPIGSSTPSASSPAVAPSDASHPEVPANIPADDPTVGRYVVRNDDPNWVANANEFWNGISGFPNGFLFSNVQYFWAYPFEFNSSELSYVNSVNVADTEVHGNWWFFTTYQNWGDGVDLTAIPWWQGFGRAQGGQLAYWTLHSCEVVPSYIDAPCSSDSRAWWTPWFNIFQGLHTVVGYRTIMYIDDDATGPFANSLEWGAPYISAWFNAVNSAPDYSSHPTSTAHCGSALPMGKPSAVTVCGHENDTVYNEEALPAASCLNNIYQP